MILSNQSKILFEYNMACEITLLISLVYLISGGFKVLRTGLSMGDT